MKISVSKSDEMMLVQDPILWEVQLTKKLVEMTIEELWQLFPIELFDHRNDYFDWFDKEKILLESIIPHEWLYRISHIGSTAVSGLFSKKIVDILLEVHDSAQVEDAGILLSQNGWTVMSRSNGEDHQIALNKGYTEDGYAEEVFHLHIRMKKDWAELYFRDYLIENKAVSEAYETLKVKLANEYRHNRDAYTKQKSAFVEKYSKEAKILYRNRYTPK